MAKKKSQAGKKKKDVKTTKKMEEKEKKPQETQKVNYGKYIVPIVGLIAVLVVLAVIIIGLIPVRTPVVDPIPIDYEEDDDANLIDETINEVEDIFEEITPDPFLTSSQEQDLQDSLDQGQTTVLTDEQFALAKGQSKTIGIGLINRVGLKYFVVTYSFIEAVIDGQTQRLGLDADEWISPQYEKFQLVKGDQKFLPLLIKVPENIQKGRYKFAISFCYFDPKYTIPESGCNNEYNKKIGQSQKFTVDVSS